MYTYKHVLKQNKQNLSDSINFSYSVFYVHFGDKY